MSYTPMPVDPVQMIQFSGPTRFTGPTKVGSDLYCWGWPHNPTSTYNFQRYPYPPSGGRGINIYKSTNNGMTWFGMDQTHAENDDDNPCVLSDRLVVVRKCIHGPVSFKDYRLSNASSEQDTYGTAYGTAGGPTETTPNNLYAVQAVRLSNGDTILVYGRTSTGNKIYWARFSGGTWSSVDNAISTATNNTIADITMDSDIIHILTYDFVSGTTASYYRWTAGSLSSPITVTPFTSISGLQNLCVCNGDLFIADGGIDGSGNVQEVVHIGSPASSFTSFTDENAGPSIGASVTSDYPFIYPDGTDLVMISLGSDKDVFRSDDFLYKNVRSAGTWGTWQAIYDLMTDYPYTSKPYPGFFDLDWYFPSGTADGGIIVQIGVPNIGGIHYTHFYLFTAGGAPARVNLAY